VICSAAMQFTANTLIEWNQEIDLSQEQLKKRRISGRLEYSASATMIAMKLFFSVLAVAIFVALRLGLQATLITSRYGVHLPRGLRGFLLGEQRPR